LVSSGRAPDDEAGGGTVADGLADASGSGDLAGDVVGPHAEPAVVTARIAAGVTYRRILLKFIV
jgi:hypothetical protein